MKQLQKEPTEGQYVCMWIQEGELCSLTMRTENGVKEFMQIDNHNSLHLRWEWLPFDKYFDQVPEHDTFWAAF